MSGTTAYRIVGSLRRRDDALSESTRAVAEEVPVAFSYGGSTHAVMMATPADLADFAVGFSLTEGIVAHPSQIDTIDIVETGQGYDVQMALCDASADALRHRRRHMAGPVGCGLCGVESIEQAVRPVPDLSQNTAVFGMETVIAAIEALGAAQALHRVTAAVHGAAFYRPDKGLLALREDVGRHNALDKLAGAMAREGHAGRDGVVAVTSRISVEMVQKTALLGSPVLIAISAPTALAIETAQAAGMTLAALVRGKDFEIFTHRQRIRFI